MSPSPPRWPTPRDVALSVALIVLAVVAMAMLSARPAGPRPLDRSSGASTSTTPPPEVEAPDGWPGPSAPPPGGG